MIGADDFDVARRVRDWTMQGMMWAADVVAQGLVPADPVHLRRIADALAADLKGPFAEGALRGFRIIAAEIEDVSR